MKSLPVTTHAKPPDTSFNRARFYMYRNIIMEYVSGSILISSLYLFKLSASLDFCLFEICILEWIAHLGKEGYSM